MIDIAPFINSIEFMLLFFFIIPATIILIVMPYIINKMSTTNFIVKDMYKIDLPDIPTNGGLVILLVTILSLSIISLFYSKYINNINFVVIVVVILFALFGILDDMIDIGRVAKLIFLYYTSYFLIPFATTTILLLPLYGPVDLGIVYLQIIIPTYVPVVANLVNMHSGFNGLAPGLSLIILITLILKTLFFGDIFNILFIVSLTGALAGYFWFEKYPSKIFWGNVGALSVGAAIGSTIVTEGYIVSGFIMLIPHTLNFLLYIYWRMRSSKYPLIKFGKVREDGTLQVPNPFTLKWILPYYFRMTEPQATIIMYLLTGVFCIVGFYLPG